jgi:hypothetical protein
MKAPVFEIIQRVCRCRTAQAPFQQLSRQPRRSRGRGAADKVKGRGVVLWRLHGGACCRFLLVTVAQLLQKFDRNWFDEEPSVPDGPKAVS